MSTPAENTPPARAVDPSDFDATVELPRTRPIADRGTATSSGASVSGSDHPRVALVEGSGPGPSEEARSLLRVRLRAVLLIVLTGFGLFLLRNLFLDAVDPFNWAFHVAVLIGLALGFTLTSVGRRLTTGQLRAIELASFALVLAFFATFQARSMLACARANDPVRAISTMKNIVLETFAVIVLYGLLIPNTWRRAARVVVPFALMPLATSLVMHLSHPEILAFSADLASFELITDNLIILTLAALIALYGTHVIHALRVEAREARRFGQYQLREKLGEGGMGEVYLAEHELLKRPCAIKLIRPESAGDPRALTRFEREVRAAARLTHPNTIEIYDYGRAEDGTFYYVMEYLPGLSFADLVNRYGPLPPGRVIYLLRQVCGALVEAHGEGLVHRDIKPANIFAARRGGRWDVAKLLDFGLVRPSPRPEDGPHDFDGEGTVSGSPLYMAPEQGDGRLAPDTRADLYALGAVGYFLLTGRPPFEGRRASAVLLAHVHDPVAPPSASHPGVPEDLERVVLRCLEKRAFDRYPDARALELALGACRSAADWDEARAALWWEQPATRRSPSAQVENLA